MVITVDKEELQIFLDELNENLTYLDSAILHLEENPKDLETIEEIFRVAHTIKGSAGFLDLKTLVALGHSMESVFYQLQQGAAPITKSVIDLLLESKDRIGNIGQALAQGKDTEAIKTDDLVKRINGLLSDVDSKKEKPKSSVTKKSNNKNTETSDIIPGTKMIRVIISAHEVVPSIRAFLIKKKISDIGNIIEQIPDEEYIESDAFAEQEVREVKYYVKTQVPSEQIPGKIRVDLIEKIEVIDSDLKDNSQIDQADLSENTNDYTESPEEEHQTSPKPSVQNDPEIMDTVRIPVSRLDILLNLVGEMVIANSGFLQIQESLRSMTEHEELFRNVRDRIKELYRISGDIQEHVMKSRLVPVGQVFNRFRRFVRDYAGKTGKKIQLTIMGEDTEIDKKIIDEIIKPLTHLVRNSLDHGIELPNERAEKGKADEGHLSLTAFQEGNYISIVVQDDGKGLDFDRILSKAISKGIITKDEIEQINENDLKNLIFKSGFSTKDEVDEISGRGIGMDVVKRSVEELNGTLDIDSFVDRGTTVTIKLPLTLAILNALMVRVGGEKMSIPMASIVETQNITREHLITVEGNEMVRLRDTLIPLIRIDQIFSLESKRIGGGEFPIIIVEYNENLIALLVDEFLNRQEMVIKSLAEHYRPIEGISGASILGDGSIILILDVHGIIQIYRHKTSGSLVTEAPVLNTPDRELKLYRQKIKETVKERHESESVQKSKPTSNPREHVRKITENISRGVSMQEKMMVEAIEASNKFEHDDEMLVMPPAPAASMEKNILERGNLDRLQKLFDPEYNDLLKEWLRQGNNRAIIGLQQLTGNPEIRMGRTKAKKMVIESFDDLLQKVHTFRENAVDFILPVLPMNGTVHFLLNQKNADKVVELLWKTANVPIQEHLKYEPLFELTNILGSSYTNSLTQVTDILIEPGVPRMIENAAVIRE